MADPGPIYELLGKLAYAFTEVQPLLPTYSHLLVSALFPIYAGAHSSLTRPGSAAKPKKAPKNETKDEGYESEEDEEDDVQQMEGLSTRDAIIFPIMAGVTLTGLYFLIKWMQDPQLLNKILNAYFSLFGVLSVSRFITDGMDLVHSLVFPRRYVNGGVLYDVHSRARIAKPAGSPGLAENPLNTSPLPGRFSQIPLPAVVKAFLWNLRNIPRQKWTAKFFLRNVASVRGHLGLHGVVGFIFALTAVGYFNFVEKPWFLTNLMGFAFSYGALQLMSPTTFATGTLLLSALFFYDIYMVFFTPMMVTVAKSLDIPIKLVFPRPDIPSADPAKPPTKQLAMLGLGDVVLPGIMIGLALRFDLYLYYLRKQTRRADEQASNQATEAKGTGKKSDASSADQPVQIVKAPYVSVSNKWGEWFWARSAAHSFPKPYFTATMIGYVVGMLATLVVMQVAKHAQPALLYLVPGVLIACWGTALVRGEVKEMQEFSEAFEEEEEQLRSQSILSKERTKRAEKKLERATKKYVELATDESGDEKRRVKVAKKGKGASSSHDHEHDHDIFYFAISAPFSFSPKKAGPESERDEWSETDSANSTVNWRSTSGTQPFDGEPAEKRRRTS
ncbi:signal peptide peptidase [Diplodia corticola]|uniref:Signal peptide peptidase n=1 Tax=Diplodia corticola TaxID=236234 RepID=A0A1J9QPA5_9PEZI|nr:signal peptide peptidase [Diplodia corticola]OJD29882.1 signal peptide peptidase [Diplodia corticola]